ncbi:sigma-70 family RNA polymerase sigma factor [Streptomyces sp. MBT97]|uniref:RNA polymerase sigma factor n=1 Tax=Streptomyces sp. MBT97 TaxID=2800411 RepID=UPI0027DD81B7|nr:sigma-70 family RNA polymerase sigma factor [Streptomyces sp. MBT97]
MSSQANAKISPMGGPVLAALVAKAGAGDRDAFATLYNEYQPDVYRYLVRRTRNRDLAEDLTQEVFVRALRRIGDFAARPGAGGFPAWLCVIARNLTIDYAKSSRVRLEVLTGEFFEADASEEHESAEAGALRELDAVEATVVVTGVMRTLTPSQRVCVEMRYLQDLSLQETASALGKAHGAVKTLTFRAMASMRRTLADEAVAA